MARAWQSIQEHVEALADARGVWLLLAVAMAAFSVFWDPVISWLLEGNAMTWGGISLQGWFLVAAFFFLFVWMFEYSVKLRRRIKPNIEATYDNSAEDCNKKVKFRDDSGNNPDGRSLRLRVETTGDAVVSHCSGFVTKIEYRSPGGAFSELPVYEPLRLPWALGYPDEFTPVNIYPKVSQFLGICMSGENFSGFIIRTPKRSLVTPQIFTDLGEYKIHVRVVAAHYGTLPRTMLVTWNGKWNELKACLVEST